VRWIGSVGVIQVGIVSVKVVGMRSGIMGQRRVHGKVAAILRKGEGRRGR
jgi:hypothetical protein